MLAQDYLMNGAGMGQLEDKVRLSQGLVGVSVRGLRLFTRVRAQK